ncbi:hypothetical protein Ciccas_009642 [Cichlidogyrus casuarinus]|uniref:Uncharacterized protein n=1 Tax=Cichlidogyrus casuarinus TaxID=1844966 RepID=A0ABD2PXG0_9PLAT
MLLLRCLVLTLLIVNCSACGYKMTEHCYLLYGGNIVQCDWDEPEKLEGIIKHYEVMVNKGEYNAILEGNTMLLKNMDGKGFQLRNSYNITISVVTASNGIENIKKLFTEECYMPPVVYHQEFMDDLAHAIARKLGSSDYEQERDLREIMAEVSQPWSYYVETIVLIISNDVGAFAGKFGRKEINQVKRPWKVCDSLSGSTTKCQQVILKNEKNLNYVFTWPTDTESTEGTSVQLRFFYGDINLDAKHFYASRIYSISESSDPETSDTSTTNSEFDHLYRFLISSESSRSKYVFLFAFQTCG